MLGFPVGRLKTGTPPRLDGRTVNWEHFEPQPGDNDPVPFSFSTKTIEQSQLTCFIGYTNEGLHQAIRDNISESPLYSGQIKGIGPRYCPSIEDKVVKFPEKTRHQLFLEPEGHNTVEVYLNGFSTSMPADFQQELVHKILGLEEASIIRPGYAIEYDFIDPKELDPYLQTTRVRGLFFAGQINGTTGYEEAACQGLLAGVNAALYVQKRDGFRLDRLDSYIGVLISDLISYGVDEPYRIFTSRAENRLSLRYDTADARLSTFGRNLGLVEDKTWQEFNDRRDRLTSLRSILENTRFKRSEHTYQELSHQLKADLGDSISLAQLSKRPDAKIDVIKMVVTSLPNYCFSDTDLETVAADILYEGYLESQQTNYSRINRYDELRIPSTMSFRSVNSLSSEMIERLERAKPATFKQARFIPGITPAALSSLIVHLKIDHAC
jgi:tRNA uridine 5-carboxymethylaminomethyl modification enzyme